MYKLFIFDFDGTLVDSFPWFVRIINHLAEKHRFKKVDLDDIEALRCCSVRQLMRMYGVKWWKLPAITRSARRMMAESKERIPLFAGVERLLEGLRAQGVTLGLVSSNGYENIANILGDRNLRQIARVESAVSVFGKRRRLKRLIKKLGMSFAETIYIGDEIRDLEAARAVGIFSGAVAWGYTNAEAMRRKAPDHLFERMSDILRLNDVEAGALQASGIG